MLPKKACFGLWPGNHPITESSWACITEGRIGFIMFSFKFRNLKWDLSTTGYSPGLILKHLSNETTNKSTVRLFPSTISCSTAKLFHTAQFFYCLPWYHYLILPLATVTVLPQPYHLHLKHLLTIILLPLQLYMFDLSCFGIYCDIYYYS